MAAALRTLCTTATFRAPNTREVVPTTEIAATATVRSPRRSTIGAAIEEIPSVCSSREAANPSTRTWRSTCP